MADLSITAANVAYTAGEITKEEMVAGATITQGQVVYKDTTDSNKAKLCQSDSTSLEATIYGIALSAASSGQPVVVAKSGKMNVGATLTVGEIYVVSQTAGGIAPEADLASGDYVSIIGVAETASNMLLIFKNSGVEVP